MKTHPEFRGVFFYSKPLRIAFLPKFSTKLFTFFKKYNIINYNIKGTPYKARLTACTKFVCSFLPDRTEKP